MAAILKCDVLPASTITLDALSRYKYISMDQTPKFFSPLIWSGIVGNEIGGEDKLRGRGFVGYLKVEIGI